MLLLTLQINCEQWGAAYCVSGKDEEQLVLSVSLMDHFEKQSLSKVNSPILRHMLEGLEVNLLHFVEPASSFLCLWLVEAQSCALSPRASPDLLWCFQLAVSGNEGIWIWWKSIYWFLHRGLTLHTSNLCSCVHWEPKQVKEPILLRACSSWRHCKVSSSSCWRIQVNGCKNQKFL